jgi:NAD(P)-dependent dehydrogenase (short-subunit alcohol dehydrogenase family)
MAEDIIMNLPYKIELSGKNIAITGGYGHLGKAIVSSLALHDARVFVMGRNEEKFKLTFGQQQQIHFVHCDVSDTDSIEGSFKKIANAAGKIDALINNAFYSKGQSPTEMTDEDWAMGIDGTLGSVFRCMRSIIPYMVDQQSGRIINLSSMYGNVAPDFSIYDESPEVLNPPHYGAAKAGVLQLTRYYASYLGKYGITVNSVTPGPFPSDTVKQNKTFVEKLAAKTCLGRIGEPEDLAGIFVFLISDAAKYITGQNFIVDGGWTTK